MRDLSPTQKNAVLQSLKESFRRYARTATGPFLKVLPRDPQELLHGDDATRGLFDAAFGADGPVAFPFTQLDLKTALGDIPTRVSKLAHAQAAQAYTTQQAQQLQMQHLVPMLAGCVQHFKKMQSGFGQNDVNLQFFGEGSRNSLQTSIAQSANTLKGA